MSAFPGIGHLALGEKYRLYIHMVLGCTNMPTFQNVLSYHFFLCSCDVISFLILSVFLSYAVVITVSAASAPICFSQNSDFKILDGCLNVLKYKV